MAIWHMAVGDLHAASAYALIPPQMRGQGYDAKPKGWSPRRYEVHSAARAMHKAFWKGYMDIKKKLPKPDYVYLMGDSAEGTICSELVQLNTQDQTDMAAAVYSEVLDLNPRAQIYGIRGTPRHVTTQDGRELDDETYDKLSKDYNICGVEDAIFGEFGGLVWKISHFVGRSSTPYGKQTPVTKQIINNTLLSDMGREHDADVLLFGHVHYCTSTGFPMSKKRAFTTPTLKMRGEAYGRRFCDFYDVGILCFKQEQKGAPVQEYGFKMPIAYTPPKLYKGYK